MTQIEIRKTVSHDLAQICRLFQRILDYPMTVTEARWLLASVKHPNQYQSLVAIKGDEVVGHIGFTISDYVSSAGPVRSVFPVAWLIDPDHRGNLGLGMFMSVLEQADTCLMFEGAIDSQKIFRGLGFKEIAVGHVYQKIFDRRAYMTTVKGPLPRRVAVTLREGGLIRPFSRHTRATTNGFELAQIDVNADHFSQRVAGTVLADETGQQLTRALRCPLVDDVRALRLTQTGQEMGSVVLYLRHSPKGATISRVVNMPFSGETIEAWQSSIQCLDNYLMSLKVCATTVISTMPLFGTALSNNQYRLIRKFPVWLRTSRRELLDARWHLGYLEGDKNYRGL